MSIQDATFVVQRGDTKFSCLGSQIGDHTDELDLFIGQRNNDHIKVQAKEIRDGDADSILFVVTDGDNVHM